MLPPELVQRFTNYRDSLNEVNDRREAIAKLNHSLSHISVKIGGQSERIFTGKPEVHADLCLKIRSLLEEAKEIYKLIWQKLNNSDFYRFHNMWRSSNQTLVNSAFLVVYLENGTMATVDDIAELLGAEQRSSMPLLLDQYVIGMVQFFHTIVRLAQCWGAYGDVITAFDTLKFYMKCVTYAKQMKITSDPARKAFESTKNEIKTVERTMYDIRIRNVLPKTEEEGRAMVKQRQRLIERRRVAFLQQVCNIKPDNEVVSMEVVEAPTEGSLEGTKEQDDEKEKLKISYFWHFNKNMIE